MPKIDSTKAPVTIAELESSYRLISMMKVASHIEQGKFDRINRKIISQLNRKI